MFHLLQVFRRIETLGVAGQVTEGRTTPPPTYTAPEVSVALVDTVAESASPPSSACADVGTVDETSSAVVHNIISISPSITVEEEKETHTQITAGCATAEVGGATTASEDTMRDAGSHAAKMPSWADEEIQSNHTQSHGVLLFF